MQETVVVTGGNGFIGGHVIAKLVEMDYKVISIDPRNYGGLFVKSGMVAYLDDGVQDIEWVNIIGTLGNKPRHIIHLGAWSNVRESMRKPMKIYQANTMSTAHILDGIFTAGDRCQVKSMVFASSSAVVSPESHYGVSKMASECMLDVFRTQMRDKISVSNLRFANVYGPRQNPANGTLIASFVDCIFTGNSPTIFGDGKQTRDYIYVDDVVNAIIACMLYDMDSFPAVGEYAGATGLNDTMSVCTGMSTSVDEIYDLTKSAADSLGLGIYEPIYIGAKPGDKGEVNMVRPLPLLDAGWYPGRFPHGGIKKQIEWADNMAGHWDDDHFMDGSLA